MKISSGINLEMDDDLDNIIQFLQEALTSENFVYIDVREVIGSPLFY